MNSPGTSESGDHSSGPAEAAGDNRFLHRSLIAVGVVVGVVGLLALTGFAVELLLLAFAGVLLAVFLRASADGVSRLTGLSEGWSLTVVLAVTALVLVAGFRLLAAEVAAQADDLTRRLPEAIQLLRGCLAEYGLVDRTAEPTSAGGLVTAGPQLVSGVAGLVYAAMDALGMVAVFLFVGVYLAIEPDLYTRGLIRLTPKSRRRRTIAVLNETGTTLRHWLVGQVLCMVIVGGLTAGGLWLLGIPAALTLGLLAGVLEFVPFLGPLLAFVPAGLVTLADDPSKLPYLGLLYLGIQSVESYVITPLVQRGAADLPPALTILAQVLMWSVAGTLGLVVATPLVACLIVLVRMLYVEDVLHDAPASGRTEAG